MVAKSSAARGRVALPLHRFVELGGRWVVCIPTGESDFNMINVQGQRDMRAGVADA
jgi:hypothetical protein